MKYLVALIVGMLVGATVLAAVLYYNPFVTSNNLSRQKHYSRTFNVAP
jgi:hypothetical protein